MTDAKPTRRNAAKTLDQIKEVLLMTNSSDEQVLAHIRQLEHYHFYLKQLGELVKTEQFANNTHLANVEPMFGDEGPFKAMVSGDGRNLRIMGGIHGARELVRGLVRELSAKDLYAAPKDPFSDAADFLTRNTPSEDAKKQTLGQKTWLLTQSQGAIAKLKDRIATHSDAATVVLFIEEVIDQLVDQNKQLNSQVGIACLALGVNPAEPNRLPTALSNLTTALRLLKPFIGDLSVSAADVKSNEKTLPLEPAVMMKPLSDGTHGVFKITQEWYDWFWAVDDLDESLSSKILERQGRMRQAIDKRVIEKMASNKDEWPRDLSLMVNFESGQAMGRPVVIFTAQVNNQVEQAFGGLF